MKTLKIITNIILTAAVVAGMAACVWSCIAHEPMIFFKTMAAFMAAGLLLGAAEGIYNAGRRDEYIRRNRR